MIKPKHSTEPGTGHEAPAVILTDVDLSKEYHRDLLCLGASRASDRLVVLECASSLPVGFAPVLPFKSQLCWFSRIRWPEPGWPVLVSTVSFGLAPPGSAT